MFYDAPALWTYRNGSTVWSIFQNGLTVHGEPHLVVLRDSPRNPQRPTGQRNETKMNRLKVNDRVQTLVFTVYPGAPSLSTKRIKCGTVVKDNLTDMVGGPEVEVLWDGDNEPCGENPNEIERV